jgi:hypothetical protein
MDLNNIHAALAQLAEGQQQMAQAMALQSQAIAALAQALSLQPEPEADPEKEQLKAENERLRAENEAWRRWAQSMPNPAAIAHMEPTCECSGVDRTVEPEPLQLHTPSGKQQTAVIEEPVNQTEYEYELKIIVPAKLHQYRRLKADDPVAVKIRKHPLLLALYNQVFKTQLNSLTDEQMQKLYLKLKTPNYG